MIQKYIHHKIAVIICAHNEERVIGALLDSLLQQAYSKDAYHIFVIADNCNDATSTICKEKKVSCFERFTSNGSTKGAALAWGINQLQDELKNFDVITLFDADNLVDVDFLKYTNEAFCSGADLVMGNRQSSNPTSSIISRLYTTYWNMTTYMLSRPHNRLGLPAMISGTGFSFRRELLKNGQWKTQTMTEDVEFYVEQVLNGKDVVLAEKAYLYDEQPETLSTCILQLRRWMTGGRELIFLFSKDLILKFFKKPSIRIFDLFMFLTLYLSSWLTFIFLLIANITVLMTAPAQLLFMISSQFFCFFIYTYIIAIYPLLISKKSILKNLKSVLLFPIMALLFALIGLYSWFFPQKEWKKIEHKNSLNLTEVQHEEGKR